MYICMRSQTTWVQIPVTHLLFWVTLNNYFISENVFFTCKIRITHIVPGT